MAVTNDTSREASDRAASDDAGISIPPWMNVSSHTLLLIITALATTLAILFLLLLIFAVYVCAKKIIDSSRTRYPPPVFTPYWRADTGDIVLEPKKHRLSNRGSGSFHRPLLLVCRDFRRPTMAVTNGTSREASDGAASDDAGISIPPWMNVSSHTLLLIITALATTLAILFLLLLIFAVYVCAKKIIDSSRTRYPPPVFTPYWRADTGDIIPNFNSLQYSQNSTTVLTEIRHRPLLNPLRSLPRQGISESQANSLSSEGTPAPTSNFCYHYNNIDNGGFMAPPNTPAGSIRDEDSDGKTTVRLKRLQNKPQQRRIKNTNVLPNNCFAPVRQSRNVGEGDSSLPSSSVSPRSGGVFWSRSINATSNLRAPSPTTLNNGFSTTGTSTPNDQSDAEAVIPKLEQKVAFRGGFDECVVGEFAYAEVQRETPLGDGEKADSEAETEIDEHVESASSSFTASATSYSTPRYSGVSRLLYCGDEASSMPTETSFKGHGYITIPFRLSGDGDTSRIDIRYRLLSCDTIRDRGISIRHQGECKY
ncbi:unnamed protein product [Cyprideis torosa]|uniref:Uncharacterized protein n=1 Tax=Cyprideis torosa TaxID=163714 RepID=A0A7R8WF33_9CRUS|nr:unnamed protein product [Cyprideis torosa]CAG0895009.1 unnamed protein product [Cyprideis torosa]